MPSIARLESTDGDPTIGALLVTWDDPGANHVVKVCQWRNGGPVDVPQTARRIVEQMIDWAGRQPDGDALRNTNWVSLTGGVCAHLAAWNAALPLEA